MNCCLLNTTNHTEIRCTFVRGKGPSRIDAISTFRARSMFYEIALLKSPSPKKIGKMKWSQKLIFEVKKKSFNGGMKG